MGFKYPGSWGDVIVHTGNRKELETSDCDGPFGEYAAPDSILLNDYTLSFSNLPKYNDAADPNKNSMLIGGFELTTYNPKSPNIYYCKDRSNGIDLTKDKAKIENSPDGPVLSAGDLKVAIKTVNGIKMLYYSENYDPIGTGLSQINKFYGNNVLVQAGLVFEQYYNSPEDKEIEKKYECMGCGGGLNLWLKEGQTSSIARSAFNTMDQIISTFKFTK